MSNTIAYVDNQTLTNIADAVRYKTGTNEKMLLSDIPDTIRNLDTSDITALDTRVTGVEDALAKKADADDVGELSQLTAPAKDNLVAAINEADNAITETNERLNDFKQVYDDALYAGSYEEISFTQGIRTVPDYSINPSNLTRCTNERTLMVHEGDYVRVTGIQSGLRFVVIINGRDYGWKTADFDVYALSDGPLAVNVSKTDGNEQIQPSEISGLTIYVQDTSSRVYVNEQDIKKNGTDFAKLKELIPSAHDPILFKTYPGIINSNGNIVSPNATEKEVYTDIMPVEPLTNYNLYIKYSSSVAYWVACAEYDSNKTFIRRIQLGSATGTEFSYSYIVPENVEYIALIYRTYGLEYSKLLYPQNEIPSYLELKESANNKVDSSGLLSLVTFTRHGFYNQLGAYITTHTNGETTTNIIPVDTNEKVSITVSLDTPNQTQWMSVATFDSNNAFVRKVDLIQKSQNVKEQTVSRQYTVASGEKYIVCACRMYSGGRITAQKESEILQRIKNVEDSDSASLISATIRTIAHRGDDIDAPQCTAPAYIAARKRGLTIAENDVWNSEDGYLVMWHDIDLSRLGNLVDINGYLMYTDGTNYYWVKPSDNSVYTWNGSNYVSSATTLANLTRCAGANYGVNSDYDVTGLNLDVLKRIDFGVYKGQEFAGTQLLTFAEWVLLCKQLGMELYIDRKITYTQAIVNELVATVKKYGMLNFTSWINVGVTETQMIRSLDPNARCGILKHPTSELISTYAQYNVGRGFFFNGDAKNGMTESAIQLGLNAGFEVEVWYVDYGSASEETVLNTIRTAVSYGVQGVTLDRYRVDEAFSYLFD